MRVVKAVAVSALFLLIPHQAPFAGPPDGDGKPVLSPQATTAVAESSTARLEPLRRGSVPSSEGFVWSVAPSRVSDATWKSSLDHLETDGYSWSVRSGGPEISHR